MTASTEIELTLKQEKALAALLSEDTISGAANVAGVAEVTLFRWLQLPEFRKHFRQMRRQLVEAALAQLQRDCTRAVRVLREVAEDGAAPATARGAASRAIIDHAIAAVEVMDLQKRVERLEELLAEQVPPEKRGRAGKRWQ